MRPLDITVEINEHGGFKFGSDRNRVRDYLAFAFAGRRCRLRISEEKRSTQANAYYWAVVIETIRLARLECGMPPVSSEDLHSHFKACYLPVRVVEVFGTTHTLLGTTVTDSTEFYDYVEAIRQDEDVRRVLAFANMEIPDPDPNYRSYKIKEVA